MNIKRYSVYNFHVFLHIMINSRKKYVVITEKTGSDEMYALLVEVESDLDDDVNNEMNDSDTEFFGNDELDYNSGSVENASDILVPAANIHSSSSGSPFFNCSPGGGKALTSQVKKYNARVQQTYYYIFLVIQSRLMSLRNPLIGIS